MLDFASVFIATSTVSSTQEISSTPPHTLVLTGVRALLLIDVICVLILYFDILVPIATVLFYLCQFLHVIKATTDRYLW